MGWLARSPDFGPRLFRRMAMFDVFLVTNHGFHVLSFTGDVWDVYCWLV